MYIFPPLVGYDGRMAHRRSRNGNALMVKLVDTPDLKSVVRKDVPVRLRLGAPIKSRIAELRSSIPPSDSGPQNSAGSAISELG